MKCRWASTQTPPPPPALCFLFSADVISLFHLRPTFLLTSSVPVSALFHSRVIEVLIQLIRAQVETEIMDKSLVAHTSYHLRT